MGERGFGAAGEGSKVDCGPCASHPGLQCRRANGSIWTPPYFDEGGGEIWMITRSVPASDAGGVFAIVTTDLPVDDPGGRDHGPSTPTGITATPSGRWYP